MAAHDIGSSSSSSSSTETPITYDVFLNFRGKDTRNNFTGFLHRALKREIINVFIDNEELRGGEEIQYALLRAIRGSRISIPIFSKGYADSKWCLLELVEIVRCHRSNGQLILPIFLDDVEPTHVRHQTGSYFEGSFQKHEEKFGVETIKKWKEALNVVGGFKGYELKQVNGDQSKLLDLIVDKVLSESRGNLLDDVKNLIGLEARVKDLLRILNVGSNDVRIVGICGIGGIGKTTIAKALYNHIFKNFHSCCFLANIKEIASGPNGLFSLQEQLIWSVSKKKVDNEMRNVDRGQQLIKERLQGENVLLILDDVDDRSQLKAFAIEFNWFGSGSRIIITSRDEHVLNVAKVDGGNIYWPTELDNEQSLRLFSLHAFSRDQPPEDYKQFSHDVLCLAGGLPLTLEVLGSTFIDVRDKKTWKSMINKLQRIPHADVLKKLRISFDNLEEDEKSIFLDVACFFVGWRIEDIISMWEACRFNPISALHRLAQKSLLKFTNEVSYPKRSYSYKVLWMHDQIKDMGRAIVFEESPREPSKRSRLWSSDEILEVLEEQKGTEMIEGILLSPYQMNFNVCLHTKSFEMMSKLRFLKIDGAHFEGDFPHLPSTLTWFKWRECPLEVANFCLKKLVHMDLSYSQIRHAWTSKPQNKNQWFNKLKVLHLQGCVHLNESPNFLWFPYLEKLNLRVCSNMVNLHKSVGDLKSLVMLYLDGTKIEELPNSICMLSSLKYLHLSQCSSLKSLPESIGDLKSLVSFHLDYTKIEELPNSISIMSSLKYLHLNQCSSLKSLPESINDLNSLVRLSLGGTKIKEFPNSTCRLSSLKKLNLNRVELLNELPKPISNLESLVELYLERSNIKELCNDVGCLEKLEVLSVKDCQNLIKLPIFEGRASCLRSINLIGTSVLLSSNDSLVALHSLKELCIGNKLETSLPPWIGGLRPLEILTLQGYTRLESLPDLSSLTNLTDLLISKCEKLKDIRSLMGTESLLWLNMDNSYTITNDRRKIFGQGTLLVDELGLRRRSECSLNVNNDDDGVCKGLILCIVFSFTHSNEQEIWQEGQLLNHFELLLYTSIRRKHGNEIYCNIKLPINGVKFTAKRDLIYIHHFKEFDWFGLPLDGANAIEIFSVSYVLFMEPPNQRDCVHCKVKFWKVLELGSREWEEQQTTNNQLECSDQMRRMVADFFRCSHDEDAGTSVSDHKTVFSKSSSYDNEEDEDEFESSSYDDCESSLFLDDDGDDSSSYDDCKSSFSDDGSLFVTKEVEIE